MLYADIYRTAWTCAVLYRGNYLPFSQQFAADMRSFAVRNYIDILLASNGMWEVAIAYCKGLVDCGLLCFGGVPVCARACRVHLDVRVCWRRLGVQ